MIGRPGLTRRAALTAAIGGSALANGPASATSLLEQLTNGIVPVAGKVRLTMPEVVEDGGAVPLAVAVDSAMTESDHVRSIHIVAAANPETTVAVFHLTPASGRAAIAARIRLAESQIVLALAEMSDGSWYSGQAPVKVAVGGCGSGAVRSADSAAIGDPRVKVPETVRAGEVFEIKTLLAHPMQTGRQTDLAGASLPRLIIARLTCSSAATELFGAQLGTGVAANPYFSFHGRLERTADLVFLWSEEFGRTFTTVRTVTVIA